MISFLILDITLQISHAYIIFKTRCKVVLHLSTTCLVQLSWTDSISRQKPIRLETTRLSLVLCESTASHGGRRGAFCFMARRGLSLGIAVRRRRTHPEASRDGSQLGLSAGLETLEGAPENASSRSASAHEAGDKLGSCCRYLQTQYWHFDLSLRCSDGSSLPNSFCFFPSCVDEWVRCVLARSLAAAGQPQCTTARFRCADRQLIKGTRAAKGARFPTGSMRTGCPRPLICDRSVS